MVPGYDGKAGMHEFVKALKAAFPLTLPVLAGYLFMGAAYGVLMDAIGYGPLWAGIMSVVVFAGSGQFVGVSLLASAFHPLYAFLLILMVNSRHIFYGISLLSRYAGTGWKKPFLIFWLTDETFSIEISTDPPPGVDRGWFLFCISGLDHLYWISGGVIGNVLGSLARFDPKGIDFVMTALFVVIFVNQWLSTREHIPALIGIFAPLAALLLFGADYFLIPAMLLIVILLTAFRRRLDVGPEGDMAEGESL